MESERKPGNVRFAEDLPRLAAAAAELACCFCDTCQNYHFLWPFLRLIDSPGSASDGGGSFEAILAELIANGRRQVLIAGAADTGLLSIVARAAVGHQAGITVLDRCNTPLELCRQFADQWSLDIETMHIELDKLSIDARFDTVFVHSTLDLVAPDRRLDVLTRLRRALRPDGRLVLRFRTMGAAEPGNLANYRNAVPVHLIERLDSLNIPLPEPRDALRRRIESYAAERQAREARAGDCADMQQLIDAAGFSVQSITPIKTDHSAAFGPATPAASNRRFVVLAAPR